MLLVVVGLALTIAVGGGVGRPDGAAAQDATPPVTGTETPATVSVGGHGSVSLKPDTAQVQIGVDITKPTLADAQSEATQQMTAIIAAIKAAGVKDEDIQTVNYSVQVLRNYDNNGNPSVIKGYQVSNAVGVKIRDLTKVGSLLDAVVAKGANNISDISFFVDDPSKAASQARTLAVQDAKQKADELAAAAGVTVRRVLSIAETSAPQPKPVAMESAAPRAAAGGAPVPVQTGNTEVDVDVQVVYEIG